MRSFVRLWGIATAAILLLSSPPVLADVTWTLATTGDWSVPTNWSGGAVPTLSDAAYILSGTVAITTT